MSGGAAILVASGVGALFGAAAAGWQIGYGAGMITKSSASRRSRDFAFDERVEAPPLTIEPLPNPTSESDRIAGPANNALAQLGIALSSLRGLRVALDRYNTAEIMGAEAASGQLEVALILHRRARDAFYELSAHWSQFAGEFRSHEAGQVRLDVREVYGKFLSELIRSGLPSTEDRYIEMFALTSDEREALVDEFLSFTPEDAAAYFGESISFSSLIDELSLNARDVAEVIAEEVRLPGVHDRDHTVEPRASRILLDDLIESTHTAVLRAQQRRPDVGGSGFPFPGPITVGIIWWPDGGRPTIPGIPDVPR